MVTKFELAASFQAADDTWQEALENTFPDAHVARYLPRGKGKPGSALHAAWLARDAARIAWESVC